MNEHTKIRGLCKERTGIVVSDCQNKTIVVKVTRKTVHKLYKKVIIRSQKFHTHDEHNVAKNGDFVRITETRPVSKKKRWRLAEILRKQE